MTARGKITACIVTPAYNEQELIGTFLEDLSAFLEGHFGPSPRYQFSILVVNDGSQDATEEVAVKFSRERKPGQVSVEVLSFTRNFGHQAALIAGLSHAAREGANLVISMDADGEHPARLIPDMLDRWEHGALIVHTARRPHPSLSWLKRASSSLYYRFLKLVSGIVIGAGMADFKLWDGGVLRQVLDFLPLCGSTRAFASWLYPSGPVLDYDQTLREGRRSRFGLRKMGSLAVGGIVRFSALPLRVSLLLGFLSVSFSVLFSIFAVISYYRGKTLGGWASLTLVITITAGLQALMIGLLGEYLLRNNFNSTLPAFVIARVRATDNTGPAP